MESRDDSESKTHFIARHARSDWQKPQSAEHLARVFVAAVMLLAGLAVIVVKTVIAADTMVQANWSRPEVILVLALIGGSIAVLFTKTFLSVMHVVWPWGKKNNGV